MSRSTAPKLPPGWSVKDDDGDLTFTSSSTKGTFTALFLEEKGGASWWSFADKMRLSSRPEADAETMIVDASGHVPGGAAAAGGSSGGGAGASAAAPAPAPTLRKWGAVAKSLPSSAPVPALAAVAAKLIAPVAPPPQPAAAPGHSPLCVSSMPAGWSKIADEDDIFFTHRTGETVWFLFVEADGGGGPWWSCSTEELVTELPPPSAALAVVDMSGVRVAVPAAVSAAPVAEAVAQAEEAAPPVAAEAPLPEGWEELKDEEGTTFFYNSATSESSWERPPAAAAAAESGDVEVAPPAAAEAPLPAGWEALLDDEGTTFYYHAELGSSWDRPT